MTAEQVGDGDGRSEAMSSAERIGRLRVPDPAEWPAEVAELASGFAEKMGFVPNVIGNFALLPDHFLGWWAYFDDLMGGSPGSRVTKAQREMIAVVVSTTNGCHY